MKTRFFSSKLMVASLLLLSLLSANAAAPKSFEKTRLSLQQQGFKTDLKDFDFSTSPEVASREAALNAIPKGRPGPVVEDPNLLEPAAPNEAIVLWKQDSIKRQTTSWGNDSLELSWEDFDDLINENESEVDAARTAILSGPIQFALDASRGNDLLLRHLPGLKKLTQTLNGRTIFALHEGNSAEAWTNLLATTRLATAWIPEPLEISHRVRFENAKLAFKATWQVLQTNGWADDQLTRLQSEWQSADFLGRLPEIQAFRRASDLQMLQTVSLESEVAQGGLDAEAERLLLFYRDREVEFRNAVAAKSWMQARAMPGVTNEIFFEPKTQFASFRIRLNQRKISGKYAGLGVSFLGHAAEAETQRRIVITALALERYFAKYKRYPETLQPLAPEFLTSVPADFMTGQPLHYRVVPNRRFVLYSVGLDCVDNGGKIEPTLTTAERTRRLMNTTAPLPESDIVWPLEAASTRVVALRQKQSQDEADRRAKIRAKEQEDERRETENAEKARAAAMKKLLAEKPSLGKEPVHQGKPLSSWVSKAGEIDFGPAPEDAIEAIRAIGAKAIPFLLEWMPHPGAERHVEGYPDSMGIEIAWWALGEKAEAAIPELTRRLSRPQKSMDDYSIFTATAKAISYLGPKAITPMLTVATNMQGKHELWELLHNFENLGTNGASAVPALIRWANDPDSMVRNGVVSALGGIGERADLALPVLLNALRTDKDSIVRREAAEALGSFASASNVVLPELTSTLKDPDWHARGGALSGLGKIKHKPDVVVPLISPFLYDTNNVLQRTAAYALRDLESEIGYRALFQATNAPSSWPGIGDIIYQVQEKAEREKSKKP